MKTLKFLLLALVAGIFVACEEAKTDETADTKENVEPQGEVAKATTTFMVEAANSKVMWLGSKDEGQHIGSFGLTEGQLMLDDVGLTGGTAVLDLAAIQVMDEGMDDATKAKLAGHLSSEDFFDVANHPKATITITGSEPYSGAGEEASEELWEPMKPYFVDQPTHMVMAKLNVKGEEHDITFPAKVEAMEDNKVRAVALVTFNRKDYGLRFMSDTDS